MTGMPLDSSTLPGRRARAIGSNEPVSRPGPQPFPNARRGAAPTVTAPPAEAADEADGGDAILYFTEM